MMSLEEANFRLKVTRVRRKSIDRLVELADSNRHAYREQLSESLGSDDEDMDIDAFHSLYVDAPEIAFSLYALAIVHCYTILENNRKLIYSRIRDITDKQRDNLHDIRVVHQCLGKVGVNHAHVKCYKTMDEFRLVNNKIKHDRYNLSTKVVTDIGKKYEAKQLKSLYLNRAKHLDTYLLDLYRRIKT